MVVRIAGVGTFIIQEMMYVGLSILTFCTQRIYPNFHAVQTQRTLYQTLRIGPAVYQNTSGFPDVPKPPHPW